MRPHVAFKYIGVALALLPLWAIAYGLFFSTLHAVFFPLAGMAILNVFLLSILPRFWKSERVHELQSGALSVFKGINKVIVSLVLVLVYVFGVGIVFLFSRLAQKKFLDWNPAKSTWVTPAQTDRDLEM